MTEEVTAEAEVTTTESVDTSKDAPETYAKAEESESTEKPTEESDAAKAEPEKPKVDPKKAEKSYKKREKRRQRERLQELETTNERLLRALETRPEVKSEKPPKIEDFESMDDYLDARDSYRDSKKEPSKADSPANHQAAEYETYVNDSRDELIDAGSDKYEDFAEVITGEDVRMTNITRDAIFEIDDQETQVEVAYFLATNKKEATRIEKLSGIRQVKEISKLEAKLSKTSPKRPSAAPKPVSPVGGAKTSSNEYDPKDSMKVYMQKRNKRLGRT